MNRVLLVFFAVFAIAARSDGELKCYMCDSLTNPNCGDSSKNENSPLVSCNLTSMRKWYTHILETRDLMNIANLFEVDQAHHPPHLAVFSCAKMDLKMGSKNVTMRSCQSGKTATMDPCQAIETKLAANPGGHSMDFCGLCDTNGCNGAVDVAPPKILQLLFGSLGLMLFQAFRHRFA